MIDDLDMGEIRDSERVTLYSKSDITDLTYRSRLIMGKEILKKKCDRECIENDEEKFVHK